MTDKQPKVLVDPDDRSRIQHRTQGPVDIYEDVSASTRSFSFSYRPSVPQELRDLFELYKERPHVTRLVLEIASIEGSLPYLVIPIFLKFFQSFTPALSLWYTTQFLKLVETAIEERKIDQNALIWMAGGRSLAFFLQKVMEEAETYFRQKLNNHLERHFDIRKYEFAAKFDVPTFDSPDVQSVLDSNQFNSYTPLWSAPQTAISLISSAIALVASAVVLFGVMREHSGMRFLLLSGLWRVVFDAFRDRVESRHDVLRVFKSRNRDFLNAHGLRLMFTDNCYRQDMVAGGLSRFLLKQYAACVHALGDHSSCRMTYCRIHDSSLKDWHSVLSKALEFTSEPAGALGEIYTCIRVVNYPASAPISLATLRFIEGTVDTLLNDIRMLRSLCTTLVEHVKAIGEYYRSMELPNKIKDGSTPFPENQLDMRNGISVEFRNVSFKYSDDSETLVLRNVSFKIEQGQLCVIVGENGSGKSTILTLMTRIHDVTEGEILFNGLDIRTLKLADVRKAMAVLFQEYTIFPFSFGENIAYGDPDNFNDTEKIQQAAKLGGADEFIEALPHKYDTYLCRPVYDTWYTPSEESHSAFAGKELDFSKLKLNDMEQDLSGGQKQRIAVSRTFMKSVVSPENTVGLLLFDEPSASLDPKAEHELFSRLRELRGSKTMVFSSHRFGKLTRHADLILYIHKGEVLEAGNHTTLMKKEDGQYAKFWNLQAQDFL